MARLRNDFELEAQMGTLPKSDTKNLYKEIKKNNKKREILKNQQNFKRKQENGMHKRNDGQRQFER